VLKMSYTLADWLSPGQDNTAQEAVQEAAQEALRVMWCWGWNAGIGRLV
jgi:hypothetical protein